MSLAFPWTFSSDDPAGGALENRLQDVLDMVATQFPVSSANLTTNPFRASGTQALTWSASSADQSATVTHGLTVAPKQVIACNFYIAGVRAFQVFVGNFTATTFDILARPDGVHTGTVNFPWSAVA